jgi:DUF1680 family protein
MSIRVGLLKTFVVDTSTSPHAKLRPVPLEDVSLEDEFWAPRIEMLRRVTVPSQYKLLEDTGRLFNFRRAAGKARGDFRGLFFNDSDVYKWVEAAAFLLATKPDEGLHSIVREVVDDVASAQDEDGYLDTFFTFERKNQRWSNLRDMHELYCAGHLMQAAIALRRATGDQKLLEVARRLADHIINVFGPGKRPGVCGHPEIEMALVELYRETGKLAYLEMAKSFLDNRGKGLIGGSPYHVDHKPFRELSEVTGHAVRMLYLNCGAADLFLETGEGELWDALERLWHNMTECKMYITGGVGSRYEGEAFGENYELPNVRAYAETCAAIASFMWNWRMLLASGEARFADLMELVLYNGILAGISLDGKEYFYVNPLADRGLHRRQSWFDCACCPPNIARLLASLPGYFYCTSTNEIWVNLYGQSTAHLRFDGGAAVLTQRTRYPWDGNVEITLQVEHESTFSLNLRIPGWSAGANVEVNGQKLEGPVCGGDYLKLHRTWKTGDRVDMSFNMSIRTIKCNPNVYENLGRIALSRGPIIYCLEAIDNAGFDVWDLMIPQGSTFAAEWRPSLLEGVVVLRGRGVVVDSDWDQKRLYYAVSHKESKRDVEFLAVPYYAWANREPGPMTVWIKSCDI